MGVTQRVLALVLVAIASSLVGVRGVFELPQGPAASCLAGCCEGDAPAVCCTGEEPLVQLASSCGCCGDGESPIVLVVSGLDWSAVASEPDALPAPRKGERARADGKPASCAPSPEAPPPRS